MPDDMVAIKGINDGLLIALNPSEEWLTVTADLAARIDERAEFFAGAQITVDLGERPVPKHELHGLKALLERRGLRLNVVMSDSGTTIEAANALDIRTTTSTKKLNAAAPITPEEEGTSGVLIKRTLRSGRIVHSQGHVTVYGDVNPGAEIIAAGDIVIWGKLRGNVHAGANGDNTAIVCALDMMPNQLRIAGYITVSPPDKRRKAQPEVAFIRGTQIVVEAWKA